MTRFYLQTLELFSANNAFGSNGILGRHGNILGFVLLVFGLIMLYCAFKLKKMGSFYLEMTNHDPVIKETGFEPATAEVGEKRSSKIGDKTFEEVKLIFRHEDEVYEKWTPDLGMEGFVNIEYNPKDPSEFYIVDEVEKEDAPDTNEDGEAVEELKDPPNKAFMAALVFAVVLIILGGVFLADFYMK